MVQEIARREPLLQRISRTLGISLVHTFIISAQLGILILGHVTYLITSLFETSSIRDNYFTSKNNLVNQWFVKLGWGWTLFVCLLSFRSTRSFARLAAMTISWYFITQWFFGMSIIDRIFVWSGGGCQKMEDLVVVASAAHCKRSKGLWIGGFDPSGHVFLLSQSITLILGELLESRRVLDARDWPAVALVALWEWMYYITCVHFHSMVEIISGYLLSVFSILVVYRIIR